MGALGLVAMIAGTAIQAAGADAEAQAASDAAKYNARQTMNQASAEVERQNTIARRMRALNLTRVAASGVTASGSALQVLTSNERDSNKQMSNIMRAAKATAGLYRMESRAAKEAGRYKVAAAVVGGIGQIAGAASGATVGSGWGSLFAGQNSGFVGSGSGRYNW